MGEVQSSPVIVIPGVTATHLEDFYPLPPEAIWGVMESSKLYERSQLHPSDTRYEATQPAHVQPGRIYEIAYRELVEELRYNLATERDKPVPVYPFAYDWRLPLARIEEELAEFVEGVIARTKLLRHYAHGDWIRTPKVNLVGHSMGGLIIAGYVERFGGGNVDRVASLASPFRGSFEAMVKLATGTANLGGATPSSREREAARVTPSLYHLLPDYGSGVKATGDGIPRSTFAPAFFQRSILESIMDYADRFRLEARKEDRRAGGERLFAEMLAEAAAHRKRIAALDLAGAGLARDRWLCVAGADAKTRVRIEVSGAPGDTQFKLTSDDMMNKWDGAGAARWKTGDGTVHLMGAMPGFLGVENVVCVTPDDFGYWEVQDRALARAAGFHGVLPNMNMTHRLLVRHFTGRSDARGNTWGRPAPGVAAKDWEPAVRPLTAKSAG